MAAGFLGAVAFPFAIIAFVLATRANNRIDKIEAELNKTAAPKKDG